jgi:hypothetical protein
MDEKRTLEDEKRHMDDSSLSLSMPCPSLGGMAWKDGLFNITRIRHGATRFLGRGGWDGSWLWYGPGIQVRRALQVALGQKDVQLK